MKRSRHVGVVLSVLNWFKWKLYRCICWLIVEVILSYVRSNDEIRIQIYTTKKERQVMGLIGRITCLRTYKCYFPNTTNYKNQHNNQNFKTMKIQREIRECQLCIQCKIPWPDLKITWSKVRIKPVNTILSTINVGLSWTQDDFLYFSSYFNMKREFEHKIIYVALLSGTTSNWTDRAVILLVAIFLHTLIAVDGHRKEWVLM